MAREGLAPHPVSLMPVRRMIGAIRRVQLELIKVHVITHCSQVCWMHVQPFPLLTQQRSQIILVSRILKIREINARQRPTKCIQDCKLVVVEHLRPEGPSTASAANEMNFMKTKQIATVFLLSIALCGTAKATLTLVEAKKEARDTALGMAYVGKDAAYWMQSLPSAENASVGTQPFTAKGSLEQKKMTLPSVPMVISPSYRSSQTKGLLLVYTDYEAKVHASQMDDSLASVKKSMDLNTLSVATETVLAQENYVIGGVGKDDFASLIFLDKNLSKSTKIDLLVKKKGEVSSLILDQERLYAISSHSDATAYMHELSPSGAFRNSTQLRGGAATGISLGSRGFAISYRVGREVFIERFDSKMKSLWNKKLHDVVGIATRKGNLHDMQDGIAWVGANNGKLTIHKLDDNGNVIHTSIDASSGYGVPPSSYYLSIALGRDIHIRGQARKSGGPVDGSIDSIYFIDDEK